MKKNRSYAFLLYYISKHIPVKFVKALLQNTYLFHEEQYRVCLLYKFSGKKDFVKYEQDIEKHELYITTIDVEDNQVLYIFDMPEEMYPILELFFEGKYSKLPEKEELKMFLRKNLFLPRNHKIFHVLDKSPVLRQKLEEELDTVIPEDLDLSSPPSAHDEEYENRKQEHPI